MADPYGVFSELRRAREFTVTADHLKLLRRAYVGWDDMEFGAPAIDCKRPYGNSDVITDIAEILEVPVSEWAIDDDGDPKPEFEERFTRLHAETGVVLQIALATGELREGRYVREQYGTWERAAEGGTAGPGGPRGASFSNGPGGPKWEAGVPKPVTHWDFTEGRPYE